MITITVKGTFGQDMEINKADFIQRWVDHARELQHILPYGKGQQLLADVKEAAGAEFDETYAHQVASNEA